MMNKKLSTTLMYLLAIVFMGLFAKGVFAGEVPRMTKEELQSLTVNGQVVILDVRAGWDWFRSGSKIKGAIRENPKDVESWAGKYDKSKTYVLYCA
jgi:hypothetical protein